MLTPINGETFLPALFRDWLIDIRTLLGLPADLNIVSAPAPSAYALPLLEFSCPSFTLPTHDRIGIYNITMLLISSADGEPATGETDAQAVTRRAAAITAENNTIALIRAAMALKKGQQLGDDLDVTSFFDWCDDRVPPDTEDGWQLQSTQIVGQGGALAFIEDKRLRTRATNYTCRMITNEFTN